MIDMRAAPPNEVTSADGGCRLLFAFLAQWPGAAEFFRYADGVKTRAAHVAMVCMLLGLTACGTTGRHVRWYDGPPRQSGQVALLKVQRNYFGHSALVRSIDGIPITKGRNMIFNNTGEIEPTPGEHAVELAYMDSGGVHSTSNLTLLATCEAGRDYELHVAPLDKGLCKTLWKGTVGGHFHWTAWIIDAETKAVVAGRRRDEPLHWYE